jgi:DNA-binding Lrp family transcriptional regulator
MATSAVSISPSDTVNAAILAVSEDCLAGFQSDPFSEIAALCSLPVEDVLERVREMLTAGTIRRVRQTVQATRLAAGALVAWKVPAEHVDEAFDFLVKDDPFSGHVVLRSTDSATAGHDYRLWTTLKVPQGFSLRRHCEYLQSQIKGEEYRAMPARRLFVLGVGHLRRRSIEPGSKSAAPAEALTTDVVQLTQRQWAVLGALKREFTPDEIVCDLWAARAKESCLTLEQFVESARDLESLGLMGRFSTFLEHVKPLSSGERVTRYNALFHWAVPQGRELEAGCEIGRHDILTHAYWREGGPAFGNVNIMGVAHGLDKNLLLRHKHAIDEHLSSLGMPVSYTNVFWGGRSEIKPSEVLPGAYEAWCRSLGLDPEEMREPN